MLAGLLDLGEGSVITGRAAAALHGFDGFADGPVELLVRATTRIGERSARVVVPAIGPLDRVFVDGLALTSGTRTVLELLGRVSERELGNAIDSAIRLGVTAPVALRRRLELLVGRAATVSPRSSG